MNTTTCENGVRERTADQSEIRSLSEAELDLAVGGFWNGMVTGHPSGSNPAAAFAFAGAGVILLAVSAIL